MEITKLYEIIKLQDEQLKECFEVINDARDILKEKDEIIKILKKTIEVTDQLRIADRTSLLNPSLN